ncbi:MAG TPA: galactonate dehydratase [Jiangellaceae bacterium]|nr:galactonate dehydratase [Jiangellaceae bacterium]
MSDDRLAAVETFLVAPRWIFVRVSTGDGYLGWGEAIVPKRARAVQGAVADLAGNVVGTDPDRIEELAQRMRRGGFFRHGPVLATAAAAIEQALWDIKGRRYGLAVHDFLGGAVRERIRAYAWVGGDRPRDVVEHVEQRVAQGFSMVKMNATEEFDYIERGSQVTEVVQRIASIRDAVGDTVDVALDFHGRVHRGMAKVLLRELEPFRPAWIEEPLGPGHDDALPALAAFGSAIPIATGERLTSRWDVKGLLAHGVVDVLQPDVSLTGIFELEKIARMAEAYDVAVAPHCPNGPISLAASLQVGAAAGNVVVQEQSLGLHYNAGYDDLPPGELFDYLHDPEPLTPRDGHLPRPIGPGLGVEVAEDAVRASPQWTLQDADWRHPDGRIAEW